jgi:hypothetical protein
MNKFTALMLALFVSITPAIGQQSGQFQIVPLPKGGTEGCCNQHALIIDTTNGNVWMWAQNPTTTGMMVTTLQYQGQAIPHQNFMDGRTQPPR